MNVSRKHRFVCFVFAAICLEPLAGCGHGAVQEPSHAVSAATETGSGVLAVPGTEQRAVLPPLPDIALEATRLGLEAVERRDWSAAIRHFREARSAAPEHPAVLFRLALAHDRAGHALPAIAWYRAFLAVAPHANNANQIRDRIAQLEESNQEQAYQLVLVDLRIREAESGNSAVGGHCGLCGQWYRGTHVCPVAKATSSAGRAPKLDEAVARILVKSGHRDEMERLLAATPVSAEQDSGLLAAIAKALCDLGEYAEAREIAGRFSEDDMARQRETLMVETIKSQAVHGDAEEALKFAATLKTDGQHKAIEYDSVADCLAADARAHDALRILSDVSFSELRNATASFTLANALAQLGRKAAQDFCTDRGKAYVVASALAEWGYLAEAEETAAAIDEPNWRFLADLEILQARAVLKEISREAQIQEIERRLSDVTDSEVMDRGRLAMVVAQLAANDLAGAEQTASRITDSGVFAGSPFNVWLPKGGPLMNSDYAKRALMVAQARKGAIAQAQSTAASARRAGFSPDKTFEVFFEALAPGGGNLEQFIALETKPSEPLMPVYYEQELLHQAVVYHARRDDIEAARNVARFHKAAFRQDAQASARSYVAIAAALSRQGHAGESRKTFAEALLSMEGRAYTLADDLAEENDVEGLRAVVRQTWENSAGRTLPAAFQKLSRLQRSIGDIEGAEQTVRMSADYSPLAEAADWSAVAIRLEARKVCVIPAREYLLSYLNDPVMNPGEFRATQLLDMQLDLRDREARWQRRRSSAGNMLPAAGA